jgi:predicted O-methyltransferase YrrM
VITYTHEQQLAADMWNVAFDAVHHGRAMQHYGELADVLYLVASQDPPPRVVVEIGSAQGGTLMAWRSLPSQPLVYAVTLAHPWGEAVSYGATVLDGDSHDRATLQRLRDQIGGRPVDVLFLDGDHSTAGAQADWDMYSPLVRPGGLVLIHDIVCAAEPEVGPWWRKLADQRRQAGDEVSEIIARTGKAPGFGIVRMAGEERS